MSGSTCGKKSQVEVERLCKQFAAKALSVSKAMCRKLGLEYSESEDILHDTFVKILKANQQGKIPREEAEFFPYLLVILRNTGIDRLRAQNRAPKSNPDQLETTADSFSGDQSLRGLHDEIDRKLKELPENWQAALKLKVENQLTYHQIAMKLGCTHQQARTWIYRGRQMLQKTIRWEEFPEAGGFERRSK